MKYVFSSDSDLSTDYSTNIDDYNEDDETDFIPTHHNIDKLIPSSMNPRTQDSADTTTESDV